MAKVILDWDSKRKKGLIISDFLTNIRAEFSVPNDAKQMVAARGFSNYHIPDFISPISNAGFFDLGLYFEIKNSLQKNPIEYEIITTDLLIDQLIQSYPWVTKYDIPTLSLPLRQYQESGVKRGIHMGYGVMVIGTAGGKTLLMASLIETIRKHQKPFTTLVILPSNLLIQTYKEFLGFGIDKNIMSVWGGTEDFKKAPIILVSAETLKSNLTTFKTMKPLNEPSWIIYDPKTAEKDKTYSDYLKKFGKNEKSRKSEWMKKRKQILKELNDVDLILVDEVHGLRKGNVLNDALNSFDTRHRFGFTGTLPPNKLDQWNIIGNIGPVIIDINSSVLRKMGFISQVKIQCIKINYKNIPVFSSDKNDPTDAYRQECDFLYHNEFRNKIITYMTNKFEKNTLIIVDKIDHGDTLYNILSTHTNKKVYFIRGSVEMEDREKLRNLMEIENDIICIAMARIFAVGINIKNLHYIIFAQGGKAKVTLIQSIGRGLRLHEDKECLLIIDITDNTYYSDQHLADRLKYYEDEQIEYGFRELYEQ